ncbi:MAG TPA: 50S ribosomal protein L25 [Acidimicrobiia bacterium]|nr:50S ribosomal protein L25 [Acidimicrobiia bacterium]
MEVTLRAETGRSQGSRPSRRLRLSGRVPAVVYGKDIEPQAIAVDRRDLYGVLHTEAGLNALINLDIDGANQRLTMAKVVDRHPVRGEIVHVDFVTISLTETTRAEVLLELHGDPIGVREGGIIETINNSVLVEALPTDIPTSILIDVSGLNVGDTLRVSDLPVIEGVEYVDDLDDPLITVVLPAAEIAAEGEVEEGEELEEGAEAGATAAPADEESSGE